MAEKYLMLDLNDDSSLLIAEIMANKTCKKILNMLAEKDMSEGDISIEMGSPINTVDYNIKKMIKAGLIEKTKNFFWSVKGKKIESYRLANKKIVISTKPKFKGIIPAVLASGILAIVIRQVVYSYNGASRFFNSAPEVLEETRIASSELVSDAASKGFDLEASREGFFNVIFNNLFNNNSVWAWFLFGALFGILMIWLLNLSKTSKLNNLKGGKN